MVNPSLPLYEHPQETWDAKKCAKLVKRTKRDGLGTPHSLKGMLYDGEAGFHRVYNGGCVKDGQWWQGEKRESPNLAEGYEIVHVPTWGSRIIKKQG